MILPVVWFDEMGNIILIKYIMLIMKYLHFDNDAFYKRRAYCGFWALRRMWLFNLILYRVYYFVK